MTEGTLGGVSAGCKPLQTMPKMAMTTLNGGFRATVLTTPYLRYHLLYFWNYIQWIISQVFEAL